MTLTQSILVIAAFVTTGIGLFALGVSTSKDRAAGCERTCAAQNMAFIASPTGTVGNSIEGGKSPKEPDHACTCVPKPK